jgi:hypothetical protein
MHKLVKYLETGVLQSYRKVNLHHVGNVRDMEKLNAGCDFSLEFFLDSYNINAKKLHFYEFYRYCCGMQNIDFYALITNHSHCWFSVSHDQFI